MTASERLRELLPSVDGVTGLYPNGPWFDLDGERLVNLETAEVLSEALPLIADVVEAAEEIGRMEHVSLDDKLRPSLIALSDSLEGGSDSA